MRHALSAALLAPALLAGCSVHEAMHYKSTTHMPQTVTLIDTRTGESVWSCEVPVGKQLNLSFARPNRSAESDGYDEMRWAIASIGDDFGGSPSVIRVPPPSHRRLEGTLRQGPEARPAGEPRPSAAAPATQPAPTPAPAPAEAPKARKKAPEGIALPDPKQPAPR
jgi:hypothetical protein